MVQILDQYGRPLDRQVLKAPQTAKTVQLNRSWPTHPSRGITISKLPRILEAAEQETLPPRPISLRIWWSVMVISFRR